MQGPSSSPQRVPPRARRPAAPTHKRQRKRKRELTPVSNGQASAFSATANFSIQMNFSPAGDVRAPATRPPTPAPSAK